MDKRSTEGAPGKILQSISFLAFNFIGFSSEIAALGCLCQYRDNLDRLLVVRVAVGSLVFWMFASTPVLMVIISGTVVAGIYGTGGLALLWPSIFHTCNG